jgi:hypothetical protein
MFDLNKKKIPIALFLISLVLIIFISKIKFITDMVISSNDVETIYEKIAVFRLFGNVYSYENTFFMFILLIIISIILIIFIDDESIKSTFAKLKKVAIYGNTTKVAVIFITIFCTILILSYNCKGNYFKLNKDKNDSINPDTTVVEAVAADTTAIYDTTAVETAAPPAAPADTTYSGY